MLYTSTRDKSVRLTAAEAIARGISEDGGLLLPVEIPRLEKNRIESLCRLGYAERAAFIMGMYLDGFSAGELKEYCEKAYSCEKFGSGAAAPIKKAAGKPGIAHYFLELWHGPTCAFKDMALQILPYLLTASLKKTGQKEDALILVATSGDTGKAALEGFKDVPGTRIMVFYPSEGVSGIQKLQMTSQAGGNVGVTAVKGNFDDAQTGVKLIFGDEGMKRAAAERGYKFSSANSINWGRLLPQIVYYFSSYCDLVNSGEITFGEEINYCVPTGNFGNILAAYYASEMGLPVGRLICASNRNNILSDFIATGSYDRRREFFTTISPSMDILISSNLERLLYCVSGGDAVKIKGFMAGLAGEGVYTVDGAVKAELNRLIWADYCDEAATRAAIARLWNECGYLIDTHTAVAEAVKDKYYTATGDGRKTVVVSTANPYKFCGSIIEALGAEPSGGGAELVDTLQKMTGVEPPAQIAALRTAVSRFGDTVDAGEMPASVIKFIE
ncbi:MAG: threonine synthase [Oscillospiraceae bacterium]|jgi:threonine synthase|nr:threonine synthase [Oscillospiraceae bacterium]